MRQVTIEEFHKELKSQGVSSKKFIAMVCPVCGSVQSMHDLICAGAGKTTDHVETYFGFSCVGRFTNAGPYKKGSDQIGCDWTLGGLFQIHNYEVVDAEGEIHPRFAPASAKDAQVHETFSLAMKKTGASNA